MEGGPRKPTKLEVLRGLVNGNTSDLSGLNTDSKTTIVDAINEIVAKSGAVINDSLISLITTWSSSKINAELVKKAPTLNAIFTGSVGVPDNVFSINKVTGLSDALSGLSSSTGGKANSNNPVFTGTVTIPDGALSIADVNGLAAALDAAKLTYGSKYAADPPSSYPTGYSVGLFKTTGNGDGDFPTYGSSSFRTVVTFQASGYTPSTIQIAYPYMVAAQTIRRQATSATAWGAWEFATTTAITNVSSGLYGSVPGGSSNTASGARSTVSGGELNVASGSSSTVSGGYTNLASATGSTVDGGSGNVAGGYYSTASGRGASTIASGMRAFGAQFTDPGDAQDGTVIMKRITTSNIASWMQADPNATLIIPENTTWAIDGLLVARRTDVDGENLAVKFTALVKRDVGSTGALVGSATFTDVGRNVGNVWTVSMTVSTAGSIQILCTGETGKTIRWVASLKTAQVSG